MLFKAGSLGCYFCFCFRFFCICFLRKSSIGWLFHCRSYLSWWQILKCTVAELSSCTRQNTSESWLFSTFSVTDVDLTNLIIAFSIPWPILVNGVPKVFRNQALTMGTLKVRIPLLTFCFILFDVWYCSTVPLTKKPRDTLTKWIQTAKNI